MTFGQNSWSRTLEALLIAAPAVFLLFSYIGRLIHFRADLSAHPGTPAETMLALFVLAVAGAGLFMAGYAFRKGLGITLFTLALLFAVVLVLVLTFIITVPV